MTYLCPLLDSSPFSLGHFGKPRPGISPISLSSEPSAEELCPVESRYQVIYSLFMVTFAWLLIRISLLILFVDLHMEQLIFFKGMKRIVHFPMASVKMVHDIIIRFLPSLASQCPSSLPNSAANY